MARVLGHVGCLKVRGVGFVRWLITVSLGGGGGGASQGHIYTPISVSS